MPRQVLKVGLDLVIFTAIGRGIMSGGGKSFVLMHPRVLCKFWRKCGRSVEAHVDSMEENLIVLIATKIIICAVKRMNSGRCICRSMKSGSSGRRRVRWRTNSRRRIRRRRHRFAGAGGATAGAVLRTSGDASVAVQTARGVFVGGKVVLCLIHYAVCA